MDLTGTPRRREARFSGLLVALLLATLSAVLAVSKAGGDASNFMADTSMDTNSPSKKFRVAICVVGQVARTEMDSKIENLIKVNMMHSHVHVFNILQVGQARFTNAALQTDCTAAPLTLDEVHGNMSQYVETSSVVYNYWPYGVDWQKWPGYPDAPEAKVNRLTNHINQFLSWRTCAKEVGKEELRTGLLFHAVLRIRDNAIVLEPFNIFERLVRLRQQMQDKYGLEAYPPRPDGVNRGDLVVLPVLTKACCSWRGVNDKVMLVPRFHMDNALGGMADQFYLILKNDTRPMTLTNPEGYVKLVLDKLQVPYHPEKNPRLFPIADGRCEGGESFCVVQQYKDCRPMTHSWQINECQASYSNQAYHKTGGGSGGLGERMNAAIFRILKRMDRLDALNRMGLTVSV